MASPQGGGSTRAHLKEYLRRRRTSQDSGISRPSSYSSQLAPLTNAEGELRLAEIDGLIVTHEDAVTAHKDAVAAHKVVVVEHKVVVAAHKVVVSAHEDAVAAHKVVVAAHKDAVAAHRDAVATHRLAGHERTLVALRQEQAQLRELLKTASTGGQSTDMAPEMVENNAQDEGQIVMVEL